MELFVLLHDYHFSSSRVANIGPFTRIVFGFSVSLLTPVIALLLFVFFLSLLCLTLVNLASLFVVLPICCLSSALGHFC